jgi:hypothetical protein
MASVWILIIWFNIFTLFHMATTFRILLFRAAWINVASTVDVIITRTAYVNRVLSFFGFLFFITDPIEYSPKFFGSYFRHTARGNGKTPESA